MPQCSVILIDTNCLPIYRSPGRFFAVNELKVLVIHMLLTYDIRLPPGKEKDTPAWWFDTVMEKDPGVEVQFRRRQT
jgi:hypothetical protein